MLNKQRYGVAMDWNAIVRMLLCGAIVRPMNKGLQKFICKPLIFGAPGMIRTHDPLFRSQVLYPTELRAL